jgi:hypothetical protein
MAYLINHKEMNSVPGRDGTDPVGVGAITGRGLRNNQRALWLFLFRVEVVCYS